jgi:hypothetical protein
LPRAVIWGSRDCDDAVVAVPEPGHDQLVRPDRNCKLRRPPRTHIRPRAGRAGSGTPCSSLWKWSIASIAAILLIAG